jgi:hypothetical protein
MIWLKIESDGGLFEHGNRKRIPNLYRNLNCWDLEECEGYDVLNICGGAS